MNNKPKTYQSVIELAEELSSDDPTFVEKVKLQIEQRRKDDLIYMLKEMIKSLKDGSLPMFSAGTVLHRLSLDIIAPDRQKVDEKHIEWANNVIQKRYTK